MTFVAKETRSLKTGRAKPFVWQHSQLCRNDNKQIRILLHKMSWFSWRNKCCRAVGARNRNSRPGTRTKGALKKIAPTAFFCGCWCKFFSTPPCYTRVCASRSKVDENCGFLKLLCVDVAIDISDCRSSSRMKFFFWTLEMFGCFERMFSFCATKLGDGTRTRPVHAKSSFMYTHQWRIEAKKRKDSRESLSFSLSVQQEPERPKLERMRKKRAFNL